MLEMKADAVKNVQLADRSPSGIKIIWQEIKKDRLALGSFYFLLIFLASVYIASFMIDQKAIARVDIFSIYLMPSDAHLLGTDYAGRDILGQLIFGTSNSFTISLCITILTALMGLCAGLIAGYFGGIVDNVIMRVIDFIMSLPSTMMIIVFVTVVPKFTVTNFIFIMSIFLWTGKARLIRSKTLAERELEYVQASQTLGTPHWKIILYHILPNISSVIIVNFTLNLAGNIGLETALTFLGFGLPESTPSLGTLISYARNPDVLENKWWIWLPAAAIILVLMLSINFIGHALKRSADARQRRG
ncbi:peptide/nickel transport system permease protein [Peribacillus huizhouensis]|uniref:Peptide/nickel transport system permease protein n=2 Tax=Peribacillus huizhouensis TaxID=1501239 RepID=A0ABR6CKF3_9BACI|nr:peptide/nickel transport system permease protein [Peribacillus huizhouensis]